MKCVYFDNQGPDGFEEQFAFSPQVPYTVQVKQFPAQDIVPLHYASTLEILLCDSLEGHITIDSQNFPFGGKQHFVIPPNTVHATVISPCCGKQYVLKVSFPEISHYLDIPNYLAACGCRLEELSCLCPEFAEAEKLISQLIAQDDDLPRCLICILQLFALLSKHTSPSQEPGLSTRFKNSSLQELVNWTQQNFMRRISIEEVARFTGYSKYHFCSRFKAMTGMTYLSYLNSVRISHACRLLSRGESVQKVCHEVGFDNISYFIQLFKQLRHVTPYQYALQHKVP